MVPDNSSVNLLTRAILTQAEEEARKITEDAKATAAQLIAQAEQQVRQERDAAGLAEVARAARESASMLVAARLATRRRILEVREELLNRAFQETATALGNLRSKDSYAGILAGLVREALGALDGDHFVIAVAPEDCDVAARALSSLGELTKIVEVQADKRLQDGGCVVKQADGHALYDNTFSSILARHRLRLRSLVAEALWGKDSRWDEV